MKKYPFIMFISIFVIGYFLFDYLKEDSNVLESSLTEQSQSANNQENNFTETDNLNDDNTSIKELYLDEENVDKVYLTFFRMGMLDEYLKKIVEWNNFSNLLEEYSIKLKKDNNSIEDPDFIMYFFINELFQGAYYYEKNYTVKYYTVIYKTPMRATFQNETVEFDALSVTYGTISNRFILYLKNGDKLTPYIINEDPTQFLQLYDQVDINTIIEG